MYGRRFRSDEIADLELLDGHLAPGSLIEVPHVAATAHALGNRFEGDARAEIRFQATEAGKLRPHLDLAMERFQVAPADAFSSALRTGQSAMASDPSSIPSVSRLGLATEPQSRWSRPMTIGALSSPFATSSLNFSPARARSP